MHARKLPRISEPSFDRDYGNGSSASSSKMSKSYRDRRSVSPNDRGMSPRDRGTDRSSKYGRRERDRDRERERETYFNKYNRGSRDRTRDRSPKDRKWDRRDRDRMNDRDRDRDRDRMDRDGGGGHHQHSAASATSNLKSVGDWSEHTSSSGKKYYYNCVTEVSQWEKPREWLEFERQRSSLSNSSNKMSLDRRNSQKNQVPNMRDRGLRGGNDLDYDDMDSRGGSRTLSNHRQDPDLDPVGGGNERGSIGGRGGHPEHQQDMDISSSHDTTPTSDESHPQQQHRQQQQQQQQHYQHHHHHSRTESLRDDYYDNSQDKTPPSHHPHHHPNDQGTPSPSGGPPTPTQSENPRGANDAPGSHPVNNLVSSSAVGSLVSSSPLIGLKPQIPALTPSLARFYKESLIGHVVNWPAEAVEKTCQRINEEHLNISNLGITKVSSELKMARSLVRLAEIQATLQEQRIMFLKQQSLDLESMRPRTAFLHSNNSEPQLQPDQATHSTQNNASIGTPTGSMGSTNAQMEAGSSPAVAATSMTTSTPAVVSSNA